MPSPLHTGQTPSCRSRKAPERPAARRPFIRKTPAATRGPRRGRVHFPSPFPKRRTTMTEKADVYTRVTNKILADLERGNLTWLQPWQAGRPGGRAVKPLRAGCEADRRGHGLVLW